MNNSNTLNSNSGNVNNAPQVEIGKSPEAARKTNRALGKLGLEKVGAEENVENEREAAVRRAMERKPLDSEAIKAMSDEELEKALQERKADIEALTWLLEEGPLRRGQRNEGDEKAGIEQSVATGEKTGMKTLKPSNENKAEKMEKLASAADETVDKILDKVGRGKGEGYFERPEALFKLVDDALAKSPKEVVSNFKTEIEKYKKDPTRSPEYRQKASDLYEQTKENVSKLSEQGLVSRDTIKVFLNPEYIGGGNPPTRGLFLDQYNTIQKDYSRRDGKNWMPIVQTAAQYRMRAKEMADNFAKITDDVYYQKDPTSDIDGNPSSDKYDPNGLFKANFMHVNQNKPRGEIKLRCYISADKTTDPSAVFYAWNESLSNSPLKDTLYFKFFNTMNGFFNGSDKSGERPDDIVIYKSDDIDDNEFGALLQDFQKRCNQMSPDLLPSDEKKLPPATQKIANGISIAGDPDYVNNYLRFTDRKREKHSWTTFVDKMLMLSASLAMHRLGIKADSIEAPGLEEETKKVFREFMLLSKINPDTMLPVECGDELPAWAKLGE